MPKKELTTQRDIDDAYRGICEILNHICIDDIKHLLECCYESRNKERDLDVDISESDTEGTDEYEDLFNIEKTSDISEEDYSYEQTMDDIDNETKFT
tara:strand:+ start:3520 stop:3810 length:291 start_codon:yes stop_codon:yes gene_type:complete